MKVLPTHLDTTLAGGIVTRTKYTYDAGGQFSLILPNGSPASFGFLYGSRTATQEFDYGQGAPGALLRETDTNYAWQAQGAYLDANLLALPASVAVCSPLTSSESAA